MGNGMCSRKQKKIFQFLLLLTVTFGFIYGTIFSYEMHKQLKRTEAMAIKYQQHQESLSAQLQVVYEHRSRLEKSLQKERLEHKKAKEDHLVYKLEAQQTLNKEKQDSSNRFNSLHVQHQMLKNQHDDLKKQLFSLQDEHQALKGGHMKVLDDHRQKYDQLQQASELELSKLKESVYNLQGENRQLRKAHQDVHVQLQDVRLQVEEYKQLKETLNKMPSLRQVEEGQRHPLVPLGGKQPAVSQHAARPDIPVVQGAGPERGGETGERQEEERRRELAEEEMEQAGQPQHLEESEQPQEEGEEAEHGQPDENALDHDKRQDAQRLAQIPQLDVRPEPPAQAERVKSPYEQQQEQQRLAAQQAEERRQLQLRQEALQKQRWQAQRDRELLLRAQREREMQQHREANRKEQLLREQQLRQRMQYEHIDTGIVQGEEDWKKEAEMRKLKEGEERPQEVGRGRHPEGNLAEKDLNPEDDPNNQGEDEFEEAQRGEAGPPGGNLDQRAHENPKPAVVERDGRGGRGALEIAGNPDQQEDALDEQYQEEGEEEKREEEVLEEDPYNDDNREHANVKPHEGLEKEHRDVRKLGAANEEEENYEEEDEEEVVEDDEEGAHDKPANRRAEM
ncbi:Golgi integral membrane protein 4a isoform X5 [Anguilla anguilla]|uniref:Golgi integral membrane protein 4a isoform X5 n=1 Tax=Anguilla anguilla TaxID=7936 RepID=UPI0015ACE3DC|nr:Golgi integral membrane protein 4a isoform X5 [Anguilla anguilla]